jgi:cytochrome c2
MKTDFRTRINNLSHFTDLGCFRCHNGKLVNNKGERLEKDCTNCHLIVAQGPSADLDDLQGDIRGLEFEHPVEIGEAWKQLDCTTCHTHSSGY